MKKPILVIILVVIFMLGGIKVLSNGISLLLIRQEIIQSMLDNIEILRSDAENLKGFNKLLGMMVVFINHYTTIGIILTIKGVFILVAAFYLLRLRAWARTALEILAWFDLAVVSAIAAFVVFIWNIWFSTMKPMLVEMDISPTEMLEEMPEFSYVYNQLIYSSVMVTVLLSIVILMIIFLRWKTVRNAVKSSSDSVNAKPV